MVRKIALPGILAVEHFDRLVGLTDGADVRGIAVPGMPAGSPGMESPYAVRYDVLAYDSDGNITVYATRQGQTH